MQSERGKEMLGFTDWYYQDSDIMKNILDTQGLEVDAIRFAVKDILNQCYVDTATWGLSLWEKELNITDILTNINERRQKIKILLSKPVSVTPYFLEKMINEYINDNSGKIIEHNDNYSFDVVFNRNSCFNLKKLTEILELYKPAHLGYKEIEQQSVNGNTLFGGKIALAETISVEPDTGYEIEPINTGVLFGGKVALAEITVIGSE